MAYFPGFLRAAVIKKTVWRFSLSGALLACAACAGGFSSGGGAVGDSGAGVPAPGLRGLYGDAAVFSRTPAGARVIGPQGPVTGAYLTGRFAARSNDIAAAGAAFREVALSPKSMPPLHRAAPDVPLPGDDGVKAQAGEKKPHKDEKADVRDKAHGSKRPDITALRRSFFYYLAAGDMDKALDLARRLEGDAPIVSGDATQADDTAMHDEPRGDPGGLARLTLAAEAIKDGDYAAAMARLDIGDGDPLMASVAALVNVWATTGQAGPIAGVSALKTGGGDLFKGFHPTHQGFLAEQTGQIGLASDSYKASVFGLAGPVGRAAYGAFLERVGEPQEVRAYYALISQQPGPDRRVAEAGLKRLAAGEKSDAFSNVTPVEGAAIAFYSFGAFMLEQFSDQREEAKNAGFNVGPPRYNLPLALAQLAVYLDPDLAEARRLVGLVFGVYENHEGAIRVLKEIPQTSPHYEQARVEMASNYMALEKDAAAASILRKTIARIDKPLEAQFALANAYAAMERHEEAVAAVSVVIDALPANPPEDAWRYFIVRGDAYLKADQWEKAEADLKAAVDIAPEEATTLNYLGYVWAERGVHLDKAFPLIQKAVALEPTSGAIVDSLGWAFYQTGDYETAVVHLERAAALEPADPTVTEHLGDVYWRLARKREARFQWEHALQLDPTDAQRRSIKDKLKKGLPAVAPIMKTDKPAEK